MAYKIIFVCGCIEPGSDGVGDYTRRLALELAKDGYPTSILALNDGYVDTEFEGIQKIENREIQVLRIPYVFPQDKRFELAQNWINRLNPDWLSLQYVPYSFQTKGLPLGLGKLLSKLGSERKWHIMFHEIWVGISKISPINHKITGFFQRKIARSLYTSLQPKVVTTSNRLYQLLLLQNKIPTVVLPLFSNIPLAAIDQPFISNILTRLSIGHDSRHQFVIAGIFGSIYPEANLRKAISEQLTATNSDGKKLAVLGFGRINEAGSKTFDELKYAFGGKVNFLHLGEQSEKYVSNVMQVLDLAFSCTPEQHITKSGVFAAMKLHSVNVIAPSGDIIPEYDLEIKKFNHALVNRPASQWSVDYIATEFVTLLTDNKN